VAGQFWYTTSDGKRKRTKAGVAHEYEKYQSSDKAKAERAARNNARRSALRSGRVHKGDNKEIDHINSSPRDNSPSNIRVVSRRTNRSKKENSRRRGSRRNRSTWGV
jgi:hypothetical protein